MRESSRCDTPRHRFPRRYCTNVARPEAPNAAGGAPQVVCVTTPLTRIIEIVDDKEMDRLVKELLRLPGVGSPGTELEFAL